MTRIIGLTGGIGSGKTTVAGFFAKLGVPVYSADAAGKEVMDWPEVVTAIKQTFGNKIFENNTVNRQVLANMVFTDTEALQKLNAIVHPAVAAHFRNWLSDYKNEPFIIRETAILFESGAYKDCDQIITVIAPLETRIQRVLDRDQTTREDVEKRIDNQWTDQQRISRSDYVIDNSSLTNLGKQVSEIFQKLTIRQN